MRTCYTYILEFREGTYISQVKSVSLDRSIDDWIEKIEAQKNEIQYLGEKTILAFKEELKEPDFRTPTPLKGLSNAWCISIHSKQGAGLIHIIKTVI